MIAPDLEALATPVTDLELLDGNPRRGDVDAVARSLERFGQRKPIVARRSDRQVVAGNHTLQAARKLGWSEIAVVWVDDDDVTAKAFALADNRTAELGGYDDQLLADLLKAVGDVDPALLADSGWAEDAVADLLASLEPEVIPTADTDPDDVPESAPAKTVPGDVWLLGPHRVMCGDSSSPTDVDKLLKGHRINLAFTSPPYAQQREYDKSSGFKPIPPDKYVEWFAPIAANVAANIAEDGSWFVNIKAASDGLDTELYVLDLVLAHARDWGWHFATEFCWERVGIPGKPQTRFKNQFEPIYQFTRNKWKIRPEAVMASSSAAFSYEAGKGKSLVGNQGGVGEEWFAGRSSEGLAYPGNRLPTFAGSHSATGHAAAFPVGLPEWFVKAYTDEGDTVYDPFMGSGSTLLAAHQQSRLGFGMELSPAYVDIICRRFQEHTGIKPIAESTGNEHDFTKEK
jgi:DNA modification methylase